MKKIYELMTNNDKETELLTNTNADSYSYDETSDTYYLQYGEESVKAIYANGEIN